MSNSIEVNPNSGDEYEVNVYELIILFLSRKKLIAVMLVCSAVLSIIFSLSLPNLYQSSAILAPVSEEAQSSGGLLNQVGDIANQVGLSVAAGDDKSNEAIARLSSFEFFDRFILPNINLQDLIAVKRWNPGDNTLIYDQDLYDNNSGTWVRKAVFPFQARPSSQEAFEVFKDIFSIEQDTVTFFLTISIKHQSPFVAKDWTQMIIAEINSSMRNAKKIKANRSYNYLTKQLQQAQYEQVRQTIAMLMEEEMKTLMLIESSEDYLFTIIDSPIVPELKSEPNRAFIVIFGTFLGLVSALLYVILAHYSRKNFANLRLK